MGSSRPKKRQKGKREAKGKKAAQGEKMTRAAEVAKRMQGLRDELGGLSQEKFAPLMGVTRPRISEWEAGKSEPTDEAYLRMLVLASDPVDRFWFLRQIKCVSADDLLRVVGQLLQADPSDVVAVALKQLPSETRADLANALRKLPKSAELLPIDAELARSEVFNAGDIVLLERSADPEDHTPFWDQIGLLDFLPGERRGYAAQWWPKTGLYFGRLRCKRDSRENLTYYATIGPLSDSEKVWGYSGSIAISRWRHPGASEEPAQGSARLAARQEAERLRAQESELRRSAWESERKRLRAHGVEPAHPPIFDREISGMIELQRRREGAEEKERREAEAYLKMLEEEAEGRARKEMRLGPDNQLMGAVRILGRMIAWFPAPKEEG